MALETSITNDQGVNVTYFRIHYAQVYYSERCVDVEVHGYTNADLRSSGGRPVTTETKRLTFAEMGSATEPTRQHMYEAIKARAEFSGAVDC